jgi:hypothetical protein
MKTKFSLCLLAILLGFSGYLKAQTYDKVISAEDYSQVGAQLEIVYQLNVKPYELFEISKVEVYSSRGTIVAKSVSGMQNNLGNGQHKLYWDVLKDVNILEAVNDIRIYMNYTAESRKAIDKIKKQEEDQVLQDKLAQDKRDRDLEAERLRNQKEYERQQRKTWNRDYDRFRLGITAGLGATLPKLNFDEDVLSFDEDDVTLEPVIDWNIGMTARLHLTKALGITVEGSYERSIFNFNANFQGDDGLTIDGYPAYLTLDYTKKVTTSAYKLPVYATLHLGENFALFGGMFWNFYSEATVEGEVSWSGDVYDHYGNYIDYISHSEERTDNIFSLEDIEELDVEDVARLPFRKRVSGYTMGLEIDGRHGSFRLIYNLAKESLVDEVYFENLSYQSTSNGTFLPYHILPQMDDLKVFTHQFAAQYTIWF